MKKISIEVCPYCKSENIENIGKNDLEHKEYHCHECDCSFTDDDYLHQLYWENISCLLDGTSSENPLVFEKSCVILPSIDEESCGLSDLEKLNIDKVHQIEGDGKMFYHFEGTPDTDENWLDMYELSTNDLATILESLRLENNK